MYLAIWNVGAPEIIIILVVALLLFGRRLPEVGRSLGKGIVEFKKGIKGIEDDIDESERKLEYLPADKKKPTVDSTPEKQKDTASRGNASES